MAENDVSVRVCEVKDIPSVLLEAALEAEGRGCSELPKLRIEEERDDSAEHFIMFVGVCEVMGVLLGT